VACKEGYCRLCRKQASFNHDHRFKTKVDLNTPRRTGHQLFFADLVRAAQLPEVDPEPTIAPRLRPVSLRPRYQQLICCDAARDLWRVPLRDLEIRHPEYVNFVLARAETIGQARGWSDMVRLRTQRALTIVAAVHDPWEKVLASTVGQLTKRQLPACRVIDVLEDLQLLQDDRPDALDGWIASMLVGLPAGIEQETLAWVGHMRHGGRRARPRAAQTVRNKLRAVVPFLRHVSHGYHTLRQVTREDCTAWLDTLTKDRHHAIVALRTMFKTLKTQKVIFADPTRYIRGGKAIGTIPKPLAPHLLAQAADLAADDPALRVVLALTAIHALGAEETRNVRLDDVDLPAERIHLRGIHRPLDPYTRQAISDYLELRRSTWPRTANPHLLVSKRTAHELGPTKHTWMTKRLRTMGLTTTQLRTDRFLDEAAATAGDPLHLATVFGMSTTAAVRYADAVRERSGT
jgi:Site-specific recombinase XerD